MADQFYYEAGYVDEKYFGYVADAQGFLSNYIESDYIELNYFADQSSYAILSCDAEILTGEVVEALGNWNSLFSQSLQASKSVDVNTTMSAEFTQTAYGSKDRDIELFAFTESALASAVNAIRDYELNAESAFDVATDYIRYRNNTVDADAEFSQIVINERSRASSMETQAAFSLSAVVNVVTEITSTANSEFTQSVDWSLIRYANVAASAETAISATISHIHGADIIASGFAELTANADFTASAASSINSEANVAAVIGQRLETSSTITSSTFLLANPYEYTPRSVVEYSSLTNSNYTEISYSNATKKFGVGSLKLTDRLNKNYNEIVFQRLVIGSYIYYFSKAKTFRTDLNGQNLLSFSSNLNNNTERDNLIKHNGSVFFMSDSGDVVKTSSDGYTWTSYDLSSVAAAGGSSAQTNIVGIEYLSGYWYAFCKTVFGFGVVRSTNLTSWTSVHSNTSGSWASNGYTLNFCGSYNTGSEIGYAYSVYDLGQNFIYSFNGSAWNTSQVASSSYWLSLNELRYTGGTWIIGAGVKATGNAINFYSTDKSSWSSFTPTGTIPYYENGYWFKLVNGDIPDASYVQYSSSINGSYTNTGIINNGAYGSLSQISYRNSKWQILSECAIYSSTDLTNWTKETDVSSYNSGYVIYKNINNDFSDWKTIDFWVYSTATSNNQYGPELKIGDGTNYVEFLMINGGPYASFKTIGYTSLKIINASGYGTGWHHVRISKNGLSISMFFDGVRVDTDTIVGGSGLLPTNSRVVVFNSANDIGYFDEILITDQLLTDPSATTYTVPTSPWKNNASTDLLLHFDGSLIDDTLQEVIPSAFVSSIVSVSATAGVAYDSYLADITSTSTLSAVISATVGSDIIADGFASLGCDIDKLRNFDSAITSEFAVNAETNYIIDNTASFVSAFAQHTDNSRTRDVDSAFESISTQLSAVARLAGLFVDDLTESSLSVDPVVIRSAELTASAEFAEYLDAYRVRFNESAISSEFAVVTDGVVRITSESSLTSESSVSTSGDRVRFGVADLASEFAVNASINIVGKIESSLFNNAALNITAVKITSATSTTTSETTLSADSANSLTRDYVVNANIYANLDASVKKTMYGSANFTAFYSELAVVVKQTATDVDCNVVSTMSVVAVKITDIAKTLDSQFTQTTIVDKRMNGAAGLPSQATMIVSGTTSTDTTAYLSSISFELAISYKTGAGAVDCEVVATMSVDAAVIRAGVSNLSASSSQVTNIGKILSAASAVGSTTSVSAQGTKAVYGEIHISSAMSFTAAVRELVIDEIVYVIPAEIWTYEIASETRQYNIGQETREYIIS